MAPGTDEEINDFCTLTYNTTFPRFAKIDVNGDHAHPLYAWLKHEAAGILGTEAIKWNFTKFLIGRDGTPLTRFAPFTTPEKMEASIVAALTR